MSLLDKHSKSPLKLWWNTYALTQCVFYFLEKTIFLLFSKTDAIESKLWKSHFELLRKHGNFIAHDCIDKNNHLTRIDGICLCHDECNFSKNGSVTFDNLVFVNVSLHVSLCKMYKIKMYVLQNWLKCSSYFGTRLTFE